MSNADRGPLVFYVWQSDLPARTNRSLIEEALEKACRDLKAELEPRLDSAVKGRSGSPDIAAAILEKIRAATVVVADVSIVGSASIFSSENKAPKPVPNANVMFELGYARNALGAHRVIMVCNTGYGRVEDLPFDIRGQLMITYSFRDEGGAKPAEARNELRGKLRSAVEAAIRAAEPLHDDSPAAMLFQVGASRPLTGLTIRMHYESGAWNGVMSGGSGIAVLIQSQARQHVRTASINVEPASEWPGGYALRTVGAGEVREVTFLSSRRQLPSIYELEESFVGIATTDDWSPGLKHIEVIADGYLVATSETIPRPIARAPNDAFQLMLGYPPRGMAWLGPDRSEFGPKSMIGPLPILLKPTPRHVPF